MKHITKKIKLILFVLTIVILPGKLSAQIADNVEIAALLDFYNATSNNDLAPWQTNYFGTNYRWNREKLLTSTNFDDFNLVPNGSLYTTPELRGVTLNSNKDVVTISLDNVVGAKGSIPTSINNLTALKTLQVQSFTSGLPRNEITGALPNLSSLTNLEILQLGGNDCTGVLDWLGTNGAASNKLRTIDLSSNLGSALKLTISPTSAFSNLTGLQTLSFSGNEFTTVSGSVDNLLSPHFGTLDELLTLTLTSCNLTSGSFPTEFGGMAKITSLNLSSNPSLQNVPSPIGNLTTLIYLYLTSVSLQSLPANFGQLDALQQLYLGNNSLTNNAVFTDIVSLLKECANLTTLDLTINNFSDVTSNFNQIASLRNLNLSLNPIGTSDLPNLQGSPITSLTLQACNLTTKLPSTLINLTSLNTLSLSNGVLGNNWSTDPMRNALDLNSVGIENVLKNIQSLRTLGLNYYCVPTSGPLPSWFGTGYMNLIESLDLSVHQFQLPFPANFFLMTGLKTLNLGINSLVGPLPSNFTCSSFPNLEYLYLSGNQLTSISIQQALPDLSGCSKLKYLDISSNQFSGDVPDYLRSICSLTTVSVSNNDFITLPNFKNRPGGCGLVVIYAQNNYFDFEDLDHYFSSTCTTPGISYINCTPQKLPQGVKGNPASFFAPEGFPITLQFQAPGVNNYYQWEKGGTVISAFNEGPPVVINDSYYISNATPSAAGVYNTKIRNKCMSGMEFTGANVTFSLVPPLCQSEIPVGSGTFKLDKLTGSIVFERSDCSTKIPISCVFGPASTLDNVVSAKATTHSDDWSAAYLTQAPATNPFESGERGKWRPKSSHVYNTQLVQANDKSYNGGTFRYKPFNWKTSDRSNNPGWIRVNDVLKYSPNGDAVEERNALDVKSTAKFGYKNSLPYLIAQNADYQSVLFESFENNYNGKFEDEFLLNGGALEENTGIFHSGRNSFKITGVSTVTLRSFTVTSQTKLKGIQAKVWVKGTISNSLELQVFDTGNALIGTAQGTWIANSGEWALYEALVTPSVFSTLSTGETFTLKIRHTGSVTIWIDDIRIQPKDSEMTAYVYDASSLRLLTVLDDQHFGLFYQYNAEGKLIRKMVETERGIKTIQETQYNTPKVVK